MVGVTRPSPGGAHGSNTSVDRISSRHGSGRLIRRRDAASGLTQRRASPQRAGTSQATLSAYERGLKSPDLEVAERIIEAAGYRLDLVRRRSTGPSTTAPGVRHVLGARPPVARRAPRVLRHLSVPRPEPVPRRADTLRPARRPQRRRIYERLLRRGLPRRADRLDRRRPAGRSVGGARSCQMRSGRRGNRPVDRACRRQRAGGLVQVLSARTRSRRRPRESGDYESVRSRRHLLRASSAERASIRAHPRRTRDPTPEPLREGGR